ncbi:ferric reductase like transmembrane component-domain-containing protein [Mycena metata]|uniref:Ferric reductase like transmembrane component-domain-containing protein n=1 Tax=Mycena metata TaxID=1033252 RepID=A0AAD7MSE5_9AGAR|nr:ferric reductase like transmembrane component-domain-containing protein [Mycena metata]
MLPVSAALLCLLAALPSVTYARWQWVCGITCERQFAPSAHPLQCNDTSDAAAMAGMGGTGASATADCQAVDMNYLSSEAWCLHERCEPMGGRSKVEWYWAFIQSELGVTFPSYESVLPTTMPPTMPDGLTTLNATYRLSDAMWVFTYGSNEAYDSFDLLQVLHGWLYVVSILASLVIIAVVRLIVRMMWRPYGPSSWRTGAATFFKKRLVYPALFNGRHNVGYIYNLAAALPRLLSIYIFVIIAVGVILCCIQYHSFEPNAIFSDRTDEMYSAVGVVGGVLSLAVFPLVWLMAARNNFFIPLTGWGFETFQVLHRWLGRLAFMYAQLHTVAYTAQYVRRGEWSLKYLTSLWFIWGAVAMVALFLLCTGSLRPLRTRYYETFLALHVLLSIFTIVGTQLHIIHLYGEEYHYRKWIWVVVVIWGLERTVRLLRMLVLSWHAPRAATITLVPGSDGAVMRLTVPVPRAYTPSAGHHFYVYFPTLDWRVWENHPLSVAGWTAPRVPDAEHSTATPTPGLTNPQVGALLEGPYGHRHALETFETVVLVAGGVGIAPALAYVQEYAQVLGRTERISLIFAARQLSFLREIAHYLEEAGLRGLVELKLFCTGEDTDVRTSNRDEKSEEGGDGDVTYGRPELGAVVQKEVSGAKAGRVAFYVCGPAGMSDAMRREVVNCIGKDTDGDRVSFFEEALGWSMLSSQLPYVYEFLSI